MADGFQRLIQVLREHHPEIQGHGTSLWGAKESGYRDNIRASVKKVLKPEEQARVEDLTHPPRPAGWSVSISHAAHFGGWLAIPLPARIGFDIEEGARIRKEIIERMSTPQEIADCPDPVFLWCAKESYFKSLAQDQPQAITQLNIGGWQQLTPDLFTFAASPHKAGRGWILKSGTFLYGACLV